MLKMRQIMDCSHQFDQFGGETQGFFSKFLRGGTQNFRSPSVPDGDEVNLNPTEAKTAHLQN